MRKVEGYCSVPGRIRGSHREDVTGGKGHLPRIMAPARLSSQEQMSDKSDLSPPPASQALPPTCTCTCTCGANKLRMMASSTEVLLCRGRAGKSRAGDRTGYLAPHPGRSVGTRSGGRRLLCWLQGNRLPGLRAGPLSSLSSAPARPWGPEGEGQGHRHQAGAHT